MKRILSGTLLVLTLLTGPATAEDAFSLADRIIRAHHLLSPKQIACVTYMEREDSTEAVVRVGVYERHDEDCGGDPEVAHRLFDLEINRRTGAARWDLNFPDMEMQPVPDCADCATTAEVEPRGTEPVPPSPALNAPPEQTPGTAEGPAGESCHVPAGAERRAVLDAMRGAVEHDLKQPVLFVVRRIRICGPWAFIVAEPVRPDGGAIRWQRTSCDGDVSHLVGALTLKEPSGAWRLKDYALCPTDVAWDSWPEIHQAPRRLFAN